MLGSDRLPISTLRVSPTMAAVLELLTMTATPVANRQAAARPTATLAELLLIAFCPRATDSLRQSDQVLDPLDDLGTDVIGHNLRKFYRTLMAINVLI